MKSLSFVEIETQPWVDGSPPGELVTWRFAEPTAYLPNDIECIASIQGNVQFQPQRISLGENLGERARITVTLRDHQHIFNGEPYDQGTFWGKWRARYGTKLRGKPFRLIRGILGQSLAEMDVRHYVIESTAGPTPDGTYTIVATDILKYADDDRAQAPRMSQGRLAGTIDDETTSAALQPTGIGNLDYPTSGHLCFGGKEIVAFTRSGDNLTITRGQLGTTPIAHNANDRTQLVLYYDGDDVADIISDLLENYAGVGSEYIPLTEWQAETAAHLSVIYARPITEPTGVRKLINELIAQAALTVYWDDRARLIRLKVLGAIATEATIIDEDKILEGSLKVNEQPDSRLSQILTWFQQRNPTDRSDAEDNYKQALLTPDLISEAEYGGPSIWTIKGTWLQTLPGAERIGGIHLSRFRDPPRKFSFDLMRGEEIAPGGGYRLRWRQNQNIDGTIVEAGAPIQVTRVYIDAGVIHVEAEEMLASGVVVVTHTVFLTNTDGLQNWTVPDDWNDLDNDIHLIGPGGAGATVPAGQGGKGGGGGAYSSVSNVNLTPGAIIPYRVGPGGTPDADGGDSWLGSTLFSGAIVGARGGKRGLGRSDGGQGGQASEGIGTVKFSGGNGGDGAPAGETRAGGGGAGGAAGPHGDGQHGGSAIGSSADSGAGGGAADGGQPGQDRSGDGAGAPGGNNRYNYGGGNLEQPNGQEGGGGRGGDSHQDNAGLGGTGEPLWTQTIAPIISAGPGGGAGGAGSDQHGKQGGLYGGAGSGAGQRGTGGLGAQGIIVIRWKQGTGDESSPPDEGSPPPEPEGVSAVFTSANSSSSSPQNSVNRNTQAIGTEEPTRRIVILTYHRNANLVFDSNGITGCTVGGVALTKMDQPAGSFSGGNSAFISAPVSSGGPTGTTANIEFFRSIGNGFNFVGWIVFAVYNLDSTSILDLVRAFANPTASGNIDLPDEGVLLAMGHNSDSENVGFTWGGVAAGAEVVDQLAGVSNSERISGALLNPTSTEANASITANAGGGTTLYAITLK